MSIKKTRLDNAASGDRTGRVRRFMDTTITRLTAGLSPADLRTLARGETLGRPDPRHRVHSQSFWFHIKPRYYHEAATRLTHTFRLGLLSTFLFGVEVVTGLLLMFYYTPSPERAYGDMITLVSRVPFGQMTRDLHRLAAEGLVIVVVLHLARTFVTGSYKPPRRFTWVTGVVLLVATLFMSFSGYLLPWDQLSYWAVTIGTSLVDQVPPAALGQALKLLLLGGPEVAGGTLNRFYLLHVLFVPLTATVFFAVHYYKVVRAGISLPASLEEPGQDTARRVPRARRRYYIPDVLTSEIVLLEIVTLILVGLIVSGVYPGAPLEHHANPTHTPAATAAPWYFLWLQGLLKLGNPTLFGIIIPTLFFGVLLLLPYIDRNPSRRARERGVAITLFAVASVGFGVLTWMGTPGYGASVSPAQAVIQEILPEEAAGPLRALPWDALQVGEWDTRTYALSTAGPALRGLLADTDHAIRQADRRASSQGIEGLPAGYGKLVVSDWQPGLKKVSLRVFWQPVDTPQQVFEKTVFVQQDGYQGVP